MTYEIRSRSGVVVASTEDRERAWAMHRENVGGSLYRDGVRLAWWSGPRDDMGRRTAEARTVLRTKARLYQDLHLARSRANVQRLSRHESTKRYEAKDRARLAFDKAVDMYPAADRKRVRAACKDEHPCDGVGGFLCEHAKTAQAEIDAAATAKDDSQ